MTLVPATDPSVFTLFDAVSVIANILSLVLSIVAMVLSFLFKREADALNRSTTQILIDIRSDAKLISQGLMSELRAYGESMRGTFVGNKMTTAPSSNEPSPPVQWPTAAPEGDGVGVAKQ